MLTRRHKDLVHSVFNKMSSLRAACFCTQMSFRLCALHVVTFLMQVLSYLIRFCPKGYYGYTYIYSMPLCSVCLGVCRSGPCLPMCSACLSPYVLTVYFDGVFCLSNCPVWQCGLSAVCPVRLCALSTFVPVCLCYFREKCVFMFQGKDYEYDYLFWFSRVPTVAIFSLKN